MNKKVSRILLLLLALLSAVSIANATEQREAQRKTGLSFSGTTAYCYANCKSDNHEDKVTANVMLYQGPMSLHHGVLRVSEASLFLKQPR